MNFLDLKFDILKIKAHLLLDKFKKIIKKIENILEKKNSNIYEKLQFFIN